MGLLDAFNTDEGRFGLGLLAAAAPRADGAGFGQRMMEGVNSVDAWKKQKALEAEQAMRQKMLEMQMKQYQTQFDDEQFKRDLAKKYWQPEQTVTTQTPINSPADIGPNLYSKSPSNMTAPVTTVKPAGFNYQGFVSEMAQRDPLGAYDLAQKLKPQTTKLGAGEAVYDASGKKLFENPKEITKPETQKLYELAQLQGFKGSLMDYEIALKRAGASNQTVINAGPKAFDTELGKLDAEQLGKWRDNAQNAQSALGTVQQLRSASNNGAYSGGAANLKLTVGNFINGITGAVPKGLVGSQEYNAAASNLVLEKIKALGANPSNADREFIEKTVPQLSMSAEARAALTDFIEQKALQSINLYKRADAHARTNHGLGGFNPVESVGNTDDLVRKYLK